MSGGARDHAVYGAKLARAVPHVLDLLLREVRGEAREAGEAQHHRLRELGAASRRHDQRRDRVGAIGQEVDTVEAAIGRPELVLRADILLQHVLLDADRGMTEIALRDHLVVHRVQRVEQPDRERAARTQSRARRQVGVVMDFDAFLDAHVGQDAAHCGVLDLGDVVDEFHPRIDDARLVFEERRQPAHADIAIFVDRRADHRAAVLAEPRRIVGPASEQRDTKRRAADDHTPTLMRSGAEDDARCGERLRRADVDEIETPRIGRKRAGRQALEHVALERHRLARRDIVEQGRRRGDRRRR